MLDQEARAIQDRLRRVPAFAVNETMVMAAMPSPVAQAAIDRFLQHEGAELRREIDRFRSWLRGAAAADPAEMQRRFAILRVRFNLALGNFDLFSDALTQRSETDGVLLSGLDVAASDGLRVAGRPFEDPPLLCYLDRGPGGAIRRARTRLPGNRSNPVALIRVPRERMVGHGIASSLMHEVGHQGAALLGLVASLSAELQAPRGGRARRRAPRVGAVATLDLGGHRRLLVDRPRRHRLDAGADRRRQPAALVRLPHRHRRPASDAVAARRPQLRDRADAVPARAVGPARVASGARCTRSRRRRPSAARSSRSSWRRFPRSRRCWPSTVPPSLQGRSLRQALAFDDRTPERLLALWRGAPGDRERMAALAPSLALGACGQARLARARSPPRTNRVC